jgi:hypothetical protein
MTITLDLSPELEQYLAQEASRQGLSVEAVALRVLTKFIAQQHETLSYPYFASFCPVPRFIRCVRLSLGYYT